ncbi:branched-chain amino acid ABC transporter ATP-binding protein/permease [Chitinophaga pinensis]|uniref:ABC transporter related n=1 Tax=Chitinophaga pinensis (strain ATCC 43595 / DSM 2588 / LMG 13176 / NBRC 15968 / NCIMB 11800 / UQM 2034) TaxID=485918 RepID=A0A979GVL0_CHIPD|nr:ATP-binding cassette domain-containing protein [Chitinophaga pinensis]ACU63483.1 ABC transporter related [Chitinophaga pinensis DSM 2588]
MHTVRTYIPFFLLFIPLTAGAFANAYFQSFIMEIFIWSLFAMSFNIIYGYTGLLSFGVSLFFGAGCYGFALSLIHWQLSIPGALLFAIALTTALATLTGLLVLKIRSHYFVIVSVLLTLIPFYLANHFPQITGGDDGISVQLSDKLIPGTGLSPYNPRHMYWTVCSLAILVLFLCYRFLKSPVGLILKGLRENEVRAQFLGYNTHRYQFLAYIVSAVLAGIAGSLYVLAFKYTSSIFFLWSLSGEAIIWTISGGRGTFLGPFIGTAGFLLFKDELSSRVEYYPLIVGICLILLIRYRKNGLMGMIPLPPGWINNYAGKRQLTQPATTAPPSPSNNTGLHFILSTDDLGISFDGMKAVKGVTLELSCREIKIKTNTPSGTEWFLKENNNEHFPCLTMIGLNGAGKTTLFNILSGVYTKAHGQMKLLNEELFVKEKGYSKIKYSQHEIVEKGLTRTFQQVQLFPELTVLENFQIAAQAKINKWDYSTDREQAAQRLTIVEEIISLVNLTEEKYTAAQHLSYGRQKMLDIGLSIASGGQILLLDEPTAGVSPHEIVLITNLLLRLSSTHTLILIEHDLEVVRKLGFTTCFMADGEIIAAGPPDQIFQLNYVKEKFYAS